jgi:hypothetical protein
LRNGAVKLPGEKRRNERKKELAEEGGKGSSWPLRRSLFGRFRVFVVAEEVSRMPPAGDPLHFISFIFQEDFRGEENADLQRGGVAGDKRVMQDFDEMREIVRVGTRLVMVVRRAVRGPEERRDAICKVLWVSDVLRGDDKRTRVWKRRGHEVRGDLSDDLKIPISCSPELLFIPKTLQGAHNLMLRLLVSGGHHGDVDDRREVRWLI